MRSVRLAYAVYLSIYKCPLFDDFVGSSLAGLSSPLNLILSLLLCVFSSLLSSEIRRRLHICVSLGTYGFLLPLVGSFCSSSILLLVCA